MASRHACIAVRIGGLAPYLMHAFGEDPSKGSTPEQAAERAAYRNKDGNLYLPGNAVAFALRKVLTQRGVQNGTVYVSPYEIEFLKPGTSEPIREYNVDSRYVVLPRSRERVMRHRPILPEWEAEFVIRVNPTKVSLDLLREALDEMGEDNGLGDYRPEKGGQFGTFRVLKWTEVKEEEVQP